MKFEILQQKTQRFMSEHASTILTAGGVVGTVLTATLTARATFKAAEILRDEELKAKYPTEEGKELSTFDKVRAVWPVYIPPVIIGTATISSIVMANQVSAKRAAALAAAYGISEKRFEEYREKVSEKLSGPKQQQVIDEIAQDRVSKDPPNQEVLILTDGKVLCYDMITGRYFQSSVEDIKRAENKINGEMFHHQYASLASFQDELGLPPTNFTNEVGWNLAQDGNLEVRFSTVMSPDQRPCIAMDYSVPPHPSYTQLY